MTPEYDAVVAGHICLDIIPDLTAISGAQFRERFLPGRLLEVGTVTFSTGGCVANTGLALAKLGINVRLKGLIGDDPFGRAVLDIVSSHATHLTDGMAVDPETDTSYTFIFSPKNTDRFFLHCPGANARFCARDVRDDDIAQSRLFHFGYPPLLKMMFEEDGAQLVDIFRRARNLGATTSLDMAVFDPTSEAGSADWALILSNVLPYVDVFLPNIEETLVTLRPETYREIARTCAGADVVDFVSTALISDLGRQVLAMGAKIVGLKLGHRGLYVRTGAASRLAAAGLAAPSDPASWARKELWAPCFRVEVRGTTGAGDSTVAGFLGALLRGATLEMAVTAAVAVGACSVEAADALSGVRTWAETWRRVESGWTRHQMSVPGPGWWFDGPQGLWVGPAA
jgi:sugar/nucleoside kinase (ribokinase family)